MIYLQLLLLCSLVGLVSTKEELKLSVVMFRHGDRSAIAPIPNDIYNISDWPQGFGKLSPIGMENHLLNGKFLKDRYMTVGSATYLNIDSDYRTYQVYARSTDRDRTLMSAESLLASLFPGPPHGGQNMSGPLDVWQPIPVHTKPMDTEDMLDGDPNVQQCPYYAESAPKTVKKDSDFIAFMKNNTNVTHEVLNLTGIAYQSDQYQLFKSLDCCYDTLFCEKSHKMPFKEEFEEAHLFEKVKPFGAMQWKQYRMLTDEQKSMSGGVLLNELKNRVRAAVNETDTIKLVVLSGHDTTLAAILTVLGVFDYTVPPYATLLMLEVYEEGGEYKIRLSRHNRDTQLVTYQLPGCGKDGCDLQQFYGLQSDLELTPEQFKTMCKTGLPDFVPSISKNVLLLLLVVTILLCLASSSLLAWYTYRLKSKVDWSVSNSEQTVALMS